MTGRSRKGQRRGRSLPPPVRVDRKAIGLVLAIFALAFGTLEVLSYTQKSATWDEPMHLAAGYAAAAAGDYRVDPSHPPFLRMWAALPLLAMPGVGIDTAPIDRTRPDAWLSGSTAYDFAREFLYRGDAADRLLYAARFMVVVLGIVLGVLLFAWAHEWLGFWPAVAALAFYTLSPGLAAHASLVTTDLGVACFMFGAVYFLWRTLRRWSAWNPAGLAAFFVLALATKFSALLLGPIVILLLAVVCLRRGMPLRRAAALVLILAAAGFAGLWLAYGLRYAPSDADGWLFQLQQAGLVRQQAPRLANAIDWIDERRLLPNAFTQGFLYTMATSTSMAAFLAGEISTEGWWYYFPVAFALKTPLPLIALLIIGLVLFVTRRDRLGTANELFVLLPMAVFLGVAMTSRVNIGVRHILPVYPFVLLAAAAGAGALIQARRRAGRYALGALVLLWAIDVGRVYPHTLTYFNQLAGGPRGGTRYLVDSNVDWGQDLKPLKQWMDRNGVRHVNLAYFGQADPAYYGIDCTHLPGAPSFAITSIGRPRLPGYVALSATVLSGVYLQPAWRLFYRPFHGLQPAADIGNSIRVFWVDEWPAATGSMPEDAEARRFLADALLIAMQWPEQAMVHYREYLKQRPGDADAHDLLGRALAVQGHWDEANAEFERARVARQPR